MTHNSPEKKCCTDEDAICTPSVAGAPCFCHSPVSPSREEIKIVPSPRIDYCGACKTEHGYDCPKESSPSQEEIDCSPHCKSRQFLDQITNHPALAVKFVQQRASSQTRASTLKEVEEWLQEGAILARIEQREAGDATKFQREMGREQQCVDTLDFISRLQAKKLP